ncbi:DUF4139 domain-containing protein [Thermospira aquatica]|uniref:DUF4139 domain-containing protein n=1 Tax=Thermospira aquatica TaxID=2828656 RepID=A0AAX3BGJ8_9SPIR|nr:DUF4139 domain-containing protein [Thermospira aquatica]URA11275.1 DUF4139 domain-containing protein [Thermospira aquatica]
MRKWIIIFGTCVVLFAWAQEAFVYRDRIVIERDFRAVTQIVLPLGAKDVEIRPEVSLLKEWVTNIYPENLSSTVVEYISLTNQVAQKRKNLQQLEKKLAGQNDRIKLYQDLLRGFASSQNPRTTELMEKYERQYASAEKAIRQLETDIQVLRQEIALLDARIQEISRFLLSKIIPLKILELEKPASGSLRYTLPGGWRASYTLQVEKETLGAEVEIFSSQGFQERVDSLWILGYSYTSPQMEEYLPRLKLYLQTPGRQKTFLKSAQAPEVPRAMSEAEGVFFEPESGSPSPVESSEGQGTVWRITNRVTLSRNTTVKLWEPRKVSLTNTYFVLAPRASWGWYATTLSNTLGYTLIPGEVILDSQGKTQKTILSRSLVASSTYTFPGFEVKDIEVRREVVRDYKEMPSLLRPTVQHEKHYRLTVRNRLPRTIALTVWDRFPLSSEERITVKNIFATDKSSAELKAIQTNDGIVKWQISLKPGEEKVFSFGYTIEYPKDTYYYEHEE